MEDEIALIKKRLTKYRDEGKYEFLIQEGLESLKRFPDNIELAKIVVFTLIEPSVDKPDKAYRLLKDMIAKYPDSAELHALLANCYIIYGGEDQKAYEELKQAIEIDPNRPEFYSLLAMVISTGFQVKAESAEIIDALKKAISLDPENWNYYESLGIAYWKNGNLFEAKLSLENALRKIPAPGKIFDKPLKNWDEKIYIKRLKDWINAINNKKSYWEANEVKPKSNA